MSVEDFEGSVISYLRENPEARDVFSYIRSSDSEVEADELYDEFDIDTVDYTLNTLEEQDWLERTENGYRTSETGGL